MIPSQSAPNLVVLTADLQMHRVVETLLQYRRPSLGISPDFSVEVRRHPQQDSGCRTASQTVLNPLRNTHRKVMVIFDWQGSGAGVDAVELESDLERQYERDGWETGRVAFVVIEPELDAWVFGASLPRLQQAFEWSQPQPIRDWLESRGHLQPGAAKPQDPKRAVDAIMELHRKHRTAKMYADLARNTGLARCQDRAFQKFRSTLQRWFPAGG